MIVEAEIEIEIEQDGKITLPKELRERLSLVPGTRLNVRQKGSALVLETEFKSRGLYWKNGIPVFELGYELPTDHVNWVDQNREEWADELFNR